METAAQYRKYAEECERIARQSPLANRAALLDIAKAWTALADELDRGRKVADGAVRDGTASTKSDGA
jgi:hypothetical protein